MNNGSYNGCVISQANNTLDVVYPGNAPGSKFHYGALGYSADSYGIAAKRKDDFTKGIAMGYNQRPVFIDGVGLNSYAPTNDKKFHWGSSPVYKGFTPKTE